MIASKDRGYYFGASDVSNIIGKWTSDTWTKWWLQKLSINTDNFENVYTLAGTHFEHRILESLGIPMEFDKQVILEDFRLRVNLDGNTDDCIYECKTYKAEKPFKVPLKYKRQVWVQMYGSKIGKAYIVAYGLTENDYLNYLAPLDDNRLDLFPIEYDKAFIEQKYLPRLKYLAHCLNDGIFPTEEDYEKWQKQ